MTDEGNPRWEARFRAPSVLMPDWSPTAPDRIVYESTESGVYQVHCWDMATGQKRQVTDHPVGVVDGAPTLDGEGVLYWQDETGSEAGQWFIQPFAGGEGRPFLQGTPQGWNQGFAQAPGVVVAAISDRDGFAVFAAVDGAPAKELVRSTEAVSLGGSTGGGFNRGALSSDGTLLTLEHAEHGDLIHPALRVIDPRTGAVIAEQLDGARPEVLVLVADRGRPAARVPARTFRRRATRHLGPRHGRTHRSRDRPARGDRGPRLVARRVGVAPDQPLRRP